MALGDNLNSIYQRDGYTQNGFQNVGNMFDFSSPDNRQVRLNDKFRQRDTITGKEYTYYEAADLQRLDPLELERKRQGILTDDREKAVQDRAAARARQRANAGQSRVLTPSARTSSLLTGTLGESVSGNSLLTGPVDGAAGASAFANTLSALILGTQTKLGG